MNTIEIEDVIGFYNILENFAKFLTSLTPEDKKRIERMRITIPGMENCNKRGLLNLLKKTETILEALKTNPTVNQIHLTSTNFMISSHALFDCATTEQLFNIYDYCLINENQNINILQDFNVLMNIKNKLTTKNPNIALGYKIINNQLLNSLSIDVTEQVFNYLISCSNNLQRSTAKKIKATFKNIVYEFNVWQPNKLTHILEIDRTCYNINKIDTTQPLYLKILLEAINKNSVLYIDGNLFAPPNVLVTDINNVITYGL